jgi:Sugar (and other) transporter
VATTKKSWNTGVEPTHRRVILASSLGTVFEWYDFYLYGALSAIISRQFFSGVNETTGFIFALFAFAAGFFVRPFGALVFGRLGDLVGRKHTFLVTIVLMGAATAGVGLLPSYESIGVTAPILLIVLRLLQGLALGGEYGGAATYVAEHAPEGRRGLYTSWIQTTATLGLFLSLLVILGCRLLLGSQFEEWGWRVPFLLSIVLLGISVYIRLQLKESPAFMQIRAEGKLAKQPLKEAFSDRTNLRLVLLALFGATAGQAVVWYGGQFYALFFLEKTLQVDSAAANLIIATALLIGTPFFIFFGALSDRIGRKTLVLGGCLLAALTYFPTFKAITHFANPALEHAVANAPVRVVADPADCNLQFDPIGKSAFRTSCDITKTALSRAGVPYSNAPAPGGTRAVVMIGEGDNQVLVASFDGEKLTESEFKLSASAFNATLRGALDAVGYPARADMSQLNYPMVILLCAWLVLLVTMVYGPIAAWLVELFPTRIRYTSMSLPYHLGNGWFGGFLPVTSFAIVAATGDIYAGLWYPITVALVTTLIGLLFLPDTHRSRLAD